MELGLGLTEVIPYVIYFAGIVVILLTLFYRIEVGIFFLVPLLPQQSLLERLIQFPMGKDFVDLLVIAMLLKWIFSEKQEGESKFIKTKFNLPVILLIVWTYLELWRGSVYLGSGTPGLRDPRFVIWKNFMIMPVLYFIILNNIKNPKHIKILVLIMTLSLLSIGAYFRNNFRHTDLSHYHHDMRMVGTFSYLSPNALGVFFAQYGMMTFAFLLLDKNKYRKLLYAVTIFFSIYSVMFSFSRGGYLATLLACAYLGFHKKKLLAVLVFFLLTWKVFVPTAVVERIEMSEGDRSIQERLDLWQTGREIISNNPVIGLGFATFSMQKIEDSVAEKSRESFHNGFIQVSAELGLIGLFIFLYIYILGFNAGLKLYKGSDDPFHKAMGLGLAVCVVGAFGGNVGGSYWHYINVSGFYWVTQALVVRTYLDIQKQKKSDEEATTSSEAPADRVAESEVQPVTNLYS